MLRLPALQQRAFGNDLTMLACMLVAWISQPFSVHISNIRFLPRRKSDIIQGTACNLLQIQKVPINIMFKLK